MQPCWTQPTNSNSLIMQTIYNIVEYKDKRNIALFISLVTLGILTVSIDFLFSLFQNTSFYITESLLFSSFWLLFFPLLNIQYLSLKKTKTLFFSLLITGLMIIVHLFTYPILVWLISRSFYSHTFEYKQTFNFEITEHLIKTILIYGFPLLIVSIYRHRLPKQTVTTEKEQPVETNFLLTLIVLDTNNKKTVIEVSDVLLFAANSPYITIHHPTKKYLHNQTLKSLQSQLDSSQFVRIHKSYIVNINHVSSCQSRLNGDYDLTLTDKTMVRLSRKFASEFNAVFQKSHRFAVK